MRAVFVHEFDGLHFPLNLLIDYLGYRVLATYDDFSFFVLTLMFWVSAISPDVRVVEENWLATEKAFAKSLKDTV
jgi:hypothetical protein